MRSDYVLYTIAIIFFVLTAIIVFAPFMLQAELERNLSVVATAVLGILFIGLGYLQRPKNPEIEVLEPAPTPVAITEETEITTEIAPTVTTLTEVKGIGEKRAEQLKGLDINSTEKLAEASAKKLARKLKISPKITAKWIENAKKLTESP
ncbi:hypothetical protein E3J49_01885 [Candidatus Bathyarchaeota archaeon]|nr:MAG: hypothetical protein E3J49_01885 [Candidatus Bathyarchaeota archaeon]